MLLPGPTENFLTLSNDELDHIFQNISGMFANELGVPLASGDHGIMNGSMDFTENNNNLNLFGADHDNEFSAPATPPNSPQ